MTYKHRDIVIAYMDGKKLQVFNYKGEWMDLVPFNPKNGIICYFSDEDKYRIKPETKKYRVAQMKTNTVSADTEAAVCALEQNSLFVRWLTDWVEYEV